VQVARYTEGQHFLQHEDAFPVEVARKKTYQRRATLLIYLNDVEQGGKTHFDILDFGVAVRVTNRLSALWDGRARATDAEAGAHEHSR
jgi:hypothetical protein